MSALTQTIRHNTDRVIESKHDTRQVYIEILRIVAMFFVIYNHTGSEGYFYFSHFTPDSIKFWIYLFITVFCAFAVPTYFAVSGAFILENATFDIKLIKRLLRIIIIIIGVSLLYYLKDSQTTSVSEFLSILYSSTHKYHLWFLYSYLAFLISSPFIKCIATTIGNKEYFVLFCMCTIFQGVIPVVQQLATRTDQILLINSLLKPTWIFTNIVIYPIFGYWMHNRLSTKELTLRRLGLLWACNIMCIAISCYLTLYKSRIIGSLAENNAQTYFTCFTLLNLITVFLTAKYLFKKPIHFLVRHIIISAGKASLCVYLFHPIIKDCKLYRYMFFDLRAPRYLVLIIYILVTYIICWVGSDLIIFILKKVTHFVRNAISREDTLQK